MGACASTSPEKINEEVIFQKYKLDTTCLEKWTTEQVYQWILHCENGQLRHTAKRFKKEQIDGSLLLLITENHLENELKMKDGQDRSKFQKALTELSNRMELSKSKSANESQQMDKRSSWTKKMLIDVDGMEHEKKNKQWGMDSNNNPHNTDNSEYLSLSASRITHEYSSFHGGVSFQNPSNLS
ncbi:hypothetical protein RFI_18209, partial [Reticulomyxa filosa]